MAAPNDPRTLFLPDELSVTYLHDKFHSVLLASFVAGTIGLHNIAKGKPILSGIQKYAVGIPLGVVVGHFWFKRREAFYNDRDAMFRHYIELHPEDFPVPERKYLKDLLKPWQPVR